MRQALHVKDYVQRLNRVTGYIFDHLDEPLDLLKLADIACMSPYHWHRLYHALSGETIADTVKRLRLQRAAAYLAHTDLSIAAIATKSGYPNLPSFNRLFKKAYGLPPAQYRKNGLHQQFMFPPENAQARDDYKVTIRHVPALSVIAIDHHGSYMQVGKAFHQLYVLLGANNWIVPGQRSIGVYFDDPDITPEQNLHSQAGIITATVPPIEPPLIHSKIRGGDYAVLRYQGPYASMRAAYQWLYGQWLPQSGFEAADAPIFEEYINNPREVAASELITDIYLPLLNRNGE